MQEIFIKKYWAEQDVLFYIHFLNGIAIKQIEITSKNKILLTSENPYQEDSMLYDQSLEDLELNDSDFIKKEEFYKIWNDK